LRLAEKGYFRPLWSEEILTEVLESIVRRRPDLARSSVAARIDDMKSAFPDAMITAYEPVRDALASEMTDDAHVMAAAIVGKADIIVSGNVKDFPASVLSRYSLDVQTAGQFLVHQWWLDRHGILTMLDEMEQQYDRPAQQMLSTLEKLVPEFAQSIADHLIRRAGS
jgi:predicted nucleic acid-binding protein